MILIDYPTDTVIKVLERQVIYCSDLFLSGKTATNDHVNRRSIHLANNANNWLAARSKWMKEYNFERLLMDGEWFYTQHMED